MLIIPTIAISNGTCTGSISSLSDLTAAASNLYSLNPVERARLLRKENAKTIHLSFPEPDLLSPMCVDTISELRQAIDIPFEISLPVLPQRLEMLHDLIAAGVNRIFIPLAEYLQLTEQILLSSSSKLLTRIAPVFTTADPLASTIKLIRERQAPRIGLFLSFEDDLEHDNVHRENLLEFCAAAKELGIRITGMHGVRSYSDLEFLQDNCQAIDSLVLCRALNENRFPCQMLWREVEFEALIADGPMSNLWTNPLEGLPHI